MVPISWTVLGIVTYCLLETLGGNIGLHRYYGHKTFKTTQYWDYILRILAHYIGVGSVISWVGQHRKHHDHSDTPNDVHSVAHLGWFTIIFGIWDITIERKYVKDVIRDPKLIWWNKHYWHFHLALILGYGLLDYIFNLHLLFSVYALPNLMCLISGYVLAIMTHSHGYRTYDLGHDRSTNSWIANIYTIGEGWHNNHHANPSNLKQGELWWEWDFPAWVITRFLSR